MIKKNFFIVSGLLVMSGAYITYELIKTKREKKELMESYKEELFGDYKNYIDNEEIN